MTLVEVLVLFTLFICESAVFGSGICSGSSSDFYCCLAYRQCGHGKGDCDFDSDCEAGHKCGYDNCRSFNRYAHHKADCCYSSLCGIAGQQNKRIVGGEITEPDKYPWQVLIISKKNGEEKMCGGALISDRWILTAAHCTEKIPIQSHRVFLGGHDWEKIRNGYEGTEVEIEQIVEHPHYTKRPSMTNDFCLMKLKHRIDFAKEPVLRPICLPPDSWNLYVGNRAIVTGWGRTDFFGGTSKKLREVDVQVMQNEYCHLLYQSAKRRKDLGKHVITRQMLCAGVPEGGKDACAGDSGGPLMLTYKKNNGISSVENFVHIGVVSWGENCAKAQFPGVYARTTEALHWIKQVTRGSWNTLPMA